MKGNKNHIFEMVELELNVRPETVFQEIREFPLETAQNHLSFQEILWNNDHLTNQLTTTILNCARDSLFDSAEDHPSFSRGHYTDARKAYHIKTTAITIRKNIALMGN